MPFHGIDQLQVITTIIMKGKYPTLYFLFSIYIRIYYGLYFL